MKKYFLGSPGPVLWHGFPTIRSLCKIKSRPKYVSYYALSVITLKFLLQNSKDTQRACWVASFFMHSLLHIELSPFTASWKEKSCENIVWALKKTSSWAFKTVTERQKQEVVYIPLRCYWLWIFSIIRYPFRHTPRIASKTEMIFHVQVFLRLRLSITSWSRLQRKQMGVILECCSKHLSTIIIPQKYILLNCKIWKQL